MAEGQNSAVRLSVILWLQCVALAFGLVAANYVEGNLAVLILAADLILIVSTYLLKWQYRWRAWLTFVAVLVLHISVLLRPENEATVNLPIAAISLLLWLVSLFLPSTSPRT